uniref:LRRCT domain-containing protein n=1 Tax=Branchiostoma floridae TaxID=7739 RepID=C3Y7G1_BRAFL|eukprot:XP_002607779.1 hypothetical protein BRAFLDRAFT_64161 [Branchiostoma floridae]
MVSTGNVFVKTFLLWLAFESVAGRPCAELCTSLTMPRSETPLLSCTRRGRFENLCDIKTPSQYEHTLLHSISDETLKQSSLRFTSLTRPRLFIRKSAIQRIEAGAFSHLPHLHILSLTCNSLRFINRYSFQGLEDLRILDLRRNYCNFIIYDAFTDLAKLTELYLSHNELIAIPMVAVESPPRSTLFIDLSHNSLTFISSDDLVRMNGTYLQLDQNPFKCDDEGWEGFARHMANSSRIACFESVTCGPLPDWVPLGSVSSTPDQGKTTLPATTKIEQSTYTADETTTSLNHTNKLVDEEVNVPEAHVSTCTAVVIVAVALGVLLFAFICAGIKVGLGKRAAMVPPAAHPAANTSHFENDDYEECSSYDSSVESKEVQGKPNEDCSYDNESQVYENDSSVEVQDRQHEDGSYDNQSEFQEVQGNQHEDCLDDDQYHVYDNDEDLQEGTAADEEDTMNHTYDNWDNDTDHHLASKPTDRLNSQEILHDKNRDVTDQDPGRLEGEDLESAEHDGNPNEHTTKAFADESTRSLNGSSSQQRAEAPPAPPPRMTAMATDEDIANEFVGENVCTYIFVKGNDTYEAAGTDTSRKESGGTRCVLYMGGAEDKQYGDCSYDNQFHFYEKDEDLQEGGTTADEEDTMNHTYINWANDTDHHLAIKPTDRLNNQETLHDKKSEALDQDPVDQEDTQDGGLEGEDLEAAEHDGNPNEHTTKAFANEGMNGSSSQQRTEAPPALPPKMAAMASDEGIANEFGGENVCTYIFMKGNDTYDRNPTEHKAKACANEGTRSMSDNSSNQERAEAPPELPPRMAAMAFDEGIANEFGGENVCTYGNPTEHKAKAFADESKESVDDNNSQQRLEAPPALPPRMAAMTSDEDIANEFGGENVCTYIFMKGNDTYEAAGTDNSRKESGGSRCVLYGGGAASLSGDVHSF